MSQNAGVEDEPQLFVVARNPDPESRLPYLLRLPLEDGVVLKARDSWPRASRVYCYPLEEDWPEDAEVLEQVPVASCRRRGAAIDLVLDRPRLSRSQFVFTEAKGRPAIFWQTQGCCPAGQPRRQGPQAPGSLRAHRRDRYPGALPLPLLGKVRAGRAGGPGCR